MVFLASKGFRCIAFDRRGFGRSTHAWDGHDMDTYADDLATIVASLRLDRVIHIGHSAGAGEVVRYAGKHGTKRIAKIVLVSTVSPLPREERDQSARSDDGHARSDPVARDG